MGYKQFLRSMEAAQRRHERAALRRHRELVKHAARQQRVRDKEAARQDAVDEVAEFDSYLEVLVSVHRDCADVWDWQALSTAPAPSPPIHSKTREAAARQALASYSPGFFERLFGKAKRRRVELASDIENACKAESQEYEQARVAHHQSATLWHLQREIAQGVLRRDTATYRRALEHADPFSELLAFNTRVTLETIEPDLVALVCYLEDEELVPKEELKLTAAGKVSTKDMPTARFWALQQDYVCSCALRAARETLAALPVSRVIVNVQATRMDTSTGHMGPVTLLAIHFERPALQRLNMEAIDPSDSLRNFQHRMKFKKSSGFEPVERITADEQWVSA
jgi:hypothetical protein